MFDLLWKTIQCSIDELWPWWNMLRMCSIIRIKEQRMLSMQIRDQGNLRNSWQGCKYIKESNFKNSNINMIIIFNSIWNHNLKYIWDWNQPAGIVIEYSVHPKMPCNTSYSRIRDCRCYYQNMLNLDW